MPSSHCQNGASLLQALRMLRRAQKNAAEPHAGQCPFMVNVTVRPGRHVMAICAHGAASSRGKIAVRWIVAPSKRPAPSQMTAAPERMRSCRGGLRP